MGPNMVKGATFMSMEINTSEIGWLIKKMDMEYIIILVLGKNMMDNG